MIGTIYKKVAAYISGREDIALEIRMHISTYKDILHNSEYHEIQCAFDISTQRSPNSMFGYPLVIDNELKRNEWLVQSPRIK